MGWAYREDDAMGGHDPYSLQGRAELVATRYRRSFFSRPTAARARHRRAPATSSAAATGRRTG